MVAGFSPSKDDVEVQAEKELDGSDINIALDTRSASLLQANEVSEIAESARCWAYFKLPCCGGIVIVKLYFPRCGYWRFDYVCNSRCAHSVLVRCC